MWGDALESPSKNGSCFFESLRWWDVSAGCRRDDGSSKLLRGAKSFLSTTYFRETRENGEKGEMDVVDYLSTAVLGFVAMTASSPTPERTVH